MKPLKFIGMGAILILMLTICACAISPKKEKENTTETASVFESEANTQQIASSAKEEPEQTSAVQTNDADAGSGKSEAVTLKESKKKLQTSESEEESAVKTEEELAKEAEEAELQKLAHLTVTKWDAVKTLYASSSVNVRRGPSTEFSVVGFLGKGEEIAVTGQADTGWYQITYENATAYVSNQFVQETPIPEEVPVVQAVDVVATQNQGGGIVMIGDSRFVQMQAAAPENSCIWMCKGSMGYKWLNETAIPQIDAAVGKGTKVLINLGVNDPGNVQNYLTLVNAKAVEWMARGATVYYSSVNPVTENPYVNEDQIINFNATMLAGLTPGVIWIDSHTFLVNNGYRLVDGLHFDKATYQVLFNFYMTSM